ncbi:M48 family metallopeptidase [Rhodoferax aquaticus]|uniref:Peptidase M48 n=1 Tax=Rhodoferax aquaticus TaxID=2527691 RepID=A0A515EMA1_9BURK|nr:M48 family metallopeptidase [Rhodoferax aquaticus]QDL53788.1 peptidase M48 [Rhodoferax aquaticus]
MERADFIHLVRLSEHASAEDSQAYRRGVAMFAFVGYAWVIGCVLIAAAALWWLASDWKTGHVNGGRIWLTIAAAGLLWSSLRALWLRLEAPSGIEITADDAPLLFEALAKIRKRIKGPAIDKVILDDAFNASITQIPRFGLFGGARNYLTIGLPLMFALDRSRLLAVLAHEYGHLRGGHGVLGAWIYRTRITWFKLHNAMGASGNFATLLSHGFFRWYFPRFNARTFALARQDEYEADRIAAKLLSKDIMGASLVEIEVKGAWLRTEFWRRHWLQANSSSTPVGPFKEMAKLLTVPPEPTFAAQALQEAMRRLSDIDDTHPVLRDRLHALHQTPQLPAWSSNRAIKLLGPKADHWISELDRQWRKDNRHAWSQHHAYLGRMRERAQTLMASVQRNSADELVELAQLQRRLDPTANVQVFYERALRLSPSHGGALRGLIHTLPSDAVDARLSYLEQLFEASMTHRWWASKEATHTLEIALRANQDVAPALKTWRARLKTSEEAEERAWQEHMGSDFFQSIAAHDLNSYEVSELRDDLQRIPTISRAWLVCKRLREFPQRRCYTCFLELPGMDDQSRYDLCRSLETSLSLPGSVLVLWAGHSPTLQDIQAKAFAPVFVQSARKA